MYIGARAPMKEHQDRLPLVADLLMDAAHADRHLAGEEKATVRKLLREIMGVGNTPLRKRPRACPPDRHPHPLSSRSPAHRSATPCCIAPIAVIGTLVELGAGGYGHGRPNASAKA